MQGEAQKDLKKQIQKQQLDIQNYDAQNHQLMQNLQDYSSMTGEVFFDLL